MERPDIEKWLTASNQSIDSCYAHFDMEECVEDCDCDDVQYRALALYALALEREWRAES